MLTFFCVKDEYDALLAACRGIDPNTITIEAVPLLQNAEHDPASYKSIDVHVLCPVAVAESDKTSPRPREEAASAVESDNYDTYSALEPHIQAPSNNSNDIALIDFAEVAESVLC